MENRTLLAMFINRNKLETKAIANWAPLMPSSLSIVKTSWSSENKQTYHLGSETDTSPVGSSATLQCTARAQILKAEAIGPNVPATKGKAVLANHHRLRRDQYY